MKIYYHLIYIVIILGLLYLLFQKPPIQTTVVTVTTTDTIRDTTTIISEMYKPIPVTIYHIDTMYAYYPSDSILYSYYLDYLKIKVYKDTLLNDTSALIVVNDEIQYNEIQKRSFEFQNRRPIQIINTTNNTIVNQNYNRFGIYSQIGVTKNDYSLNVGALYNIKNIGIIAGLDIISGNVYFGGIYYINKN